MTLHLNCAFKLLHCLTKELQHFFITFCYNFYISLISVKKLITPQLPCILQILTTINLYSGRHRVGLSVNNKQKVRQAMVKIRRGRGGGNHPPPPLTRYVSRNGLTIGGLTKHCLEFNQNLIIDENVRKLGE